MTYTLVTGPAEPISLTELKGRSRISHDDEDDYLTLLISASRQYAEHYCQMAIGEQTWLYTGDSWPSYLQKPPLVSVDWAKYYADDVLTTWSDFKVDASIPARLVPDDGFPDVDTRPDAVQVQFVSGVSASENIKLACLIMAAHWYEAREPVVMGTILAKVPWSATALLDSERWGDY